jgi:hypothetical protein
MSIGDWWGRHERFERPHAPHLNNKNQDVVGKGGKKRVIVLMVFVRWVEAGF